MLEKTADKNEKKFDRKEIYITYKRKNKSFMRQEDANTGIPIERNGYYAGGLQWKGKLGEERINKLLPFEFMPSK